jgi:quercetin dioxygenase-like cupin family protein
VVSKTLLKKDIGNITLFAFDKGQCLSEHTTPFDTVVYILDGEAEITIGGQLQNVSAGEMLIMPANIAHALQAKAPFKMLLVMIRGE